MSSGDSKGSITSVWTLWFAVVGCGGILAATVGSLGDTMSRLEKLESRLGTLEQKAAMIDALAGETDSPYRRYYDAMQELKRLQNEGGASDARFGSRRPSDVGKRMDDIARQLSDLEGRVTELDGGRRGAVRVYPGFGSGRSGVVGELEDRIDDLEQGAGRLRKEVQSLEFDLNYGR
jgi:hypothetical protein